MVLPSSNGGGEGSARGSCPPKAATTDFSDTQISIEFCKGGGRHRISSAIALAARSAEGDGSGAAGLFRGIFGVGGTDWVDFMRAQDAGNALERELFDPESVGTNSSDDAVISHDCRVEGGAHGHQPGE